MRDAKVNFDERLFGMEAKELDRVLETIYSWKGNVDVLIFDELQNVIGWESLVSRLRESKIMIVTGSIARLMGGEMARHFTGTQIDLNLYPFSFDSS